jgi:serine/threonine-protein kinase
MGEVYRARDMNLGRDVAIKVLRDAFAHDTDRMARFGREARLLAALNHSNIASIYGLETSGDTRALVMELAEGPSLADRIAQEPIPIEDALTISRQIAEALEYAHEKGIIHRDLKPANLKVAADGSVKILDFGLAKALDTEMTPDEIANSPTFTQMATQAGVLMGTAAYMSPEQAKGSPCDRRADIWAFGCVLYEMLTGKTAFGGDTVTDTLAAVLKNEPDWLLLPAATPPRIRVLLLRCLDKEARRRLQAIGEARIVIENVLSRVPEESESAPAGRNGWLLLPWGWAALLFVVFAALASLMAYRIGALRAGPAAPAVLRPNVDLPPGVKLSDPTFVLGPTLALSPDGSNLVVVGQREGQTQLYLRPLGEEETRPIEGTAGAQGPFFSPDGRWVGFWADGRLWKVPLAGGKANMICEAAAENGAAWLADDVIVFSVGFGLLRRVSAQGGHPEVVAIREAEKGGFNSESPVALPGGKAVLFSMTQNAAPLRVAVLTLNDGKWKPLAEGASQPRFIAPGFVVINREGTLWVAPFDTARLEAGPFTRLGEGASMAGQSPAGGAAVASYDVAAAGRSLVYVKGHSTEEPRGVYSLDLHGKPELLSPDLRQYGDAALSPDGNKIAVDVQRGQGVNEIWVLDLVRIRTWRQLTTGENDWTPAWQDDRTLIFPRGRDNGFAIWDVYAMSLTGNAAPTLLASFPHGIHSDAVAPNGSAIVFRVFGPSKSFDLWTQPLGRDGKTTDLPAKPLVATANNEDVLPPCGFSPNGRWLAYMSDATGRTEIYVTDFPEGSTIHLVTNAGGRAPCWTKDGHQIFYWKGNTVMAVAVRSAGETFEAEPPRKVFDSPLMPRWGYDVARNGSALYIAGYDASVTSPIVFVSDITADLPSGAKAH